MLSKLVNLMRRENYDFFLTRVYQSWWQNFVSISLKLCLLDKKRHRDIGCVPSFQMNFYRMIIIKFYYLYSFRTLSFDISVKFSSTLEKFSYGNTQDSVPGLHLLLFSTSGLFL